MRRTLALLAVGGLLVATTLITRHATDDSPRQFCTAAAIITMRWVEVDGKRFTIGHAGEDDELARGCNHFVGPVIQPNCVAWDEVDGETTRIGKMPPFFTDGTCDGSGGGTRLADAPPLVTAPEPTRLRPSR
jgi:hypothetical protein